MNKVIFLTGATGLVGSSLIPRILKNDTEAKLVLLVRGQTDYDARLRLEDLYSGWLPDFRTKKISERVCVVKGDVTEDKFGLTESQYTMLACQITHVIHSAASVQFQLPLEQARQINGTGTAHVMRLAQKAQRSGQLKGVAYISTAYISGQRSGKIYESECDCGQPFANTYEQSKFECEQKVRQLMPELPITIFRPSIIVGDSSTGRTTSFNVLYFPLKLIYRGLLKILPGWRDTPTDVVPVDYVCDAIYHIFLNSPDGIGKTFQLTAGEENTPAAGEVIDLAVQYFNTLSKNPRIPRVEFVPPQFFRASKHFAQSQAQKIFELIETYEPYLCIKRSFDNSNTRRALSGTAITPQHYKHYFENILQYSIACDWGKRTVPIAAHV